MAKYCLLCGSGNDDRALFCAACGTELVDDERMEELGEIDTPSGIFLSRVEAPDGIVGEDEMPLMVLPDGTILKGVYQVNYLTCGGMGAIYKAIDLETKKEYVIKEAVSTDPTEKSRLMMALSREREALIRLVHPGIIKCNEFFEEGESWYLVLEYFDGQTLAEVQEAIKPGFLAEVDVLNWTAQLAEILDYMHNLNPSVIYRDLKPSNAMVNHVGKVKLIDFGIARIHKKGRTGDTEVIGTVGFCPPEQYGEGQTDARSDIYSLGAMMHSLLTNVVPGTKGANPFEFCPVRMVNPNVSRQTEAIIKKATKMQPGDRYENMEKMLMVINSAYTNAKEQSLGLPKLEVDPVNLDLMRIGFDEKRTARFLITNAGKGTLSGTINPPKTKGINVHPRTINSNKRVVELEVDGAQLPAYKDHKINIVIRTNGGNFVLPVNFSIGLTPKLAVSPAFLQFILNNDQVSFPKDLIMVNKGANILEGVVRCKEPWVQIGMKEFRGNFTKIPVQIEPYNLFPGRSYVTKIVINTNGGTKEVRVNVVLRLSFSHLEDTLAHIAQCEEKVALSKMLRDMRVQEVPGRIRIIDRLSQSDHRDLFVPHIMEALERDSSDEVRVKAAELLFKITPKQAAPSFIEALGDPSPKVRALAARALGDIEEESAIEYLLKLVADKDPEVRQAARTAVTQIAPKKASSALAPITDAVKGFDLEAATEAATKKLQNVQSVARGFWTKIMKKQN